MESVQSRRLRHVVIGAGAGVFNMHRKALQLPTVELVAIAEINPDSGRLRAEELDCKLYTDYRQMLAETRPDVAVIVTPHPLHARIAIDCLQAGCHVLVEKPLALQVAEADAMIACAAQQQKLLGVVFQQRFRPEIRAAYKLIQEGSLGIIQHVEMEVMWTRPESYFQQASWRGTWLGEGGGVLMNQGVHNMDLLCHLLGMPVRVSAWTRRLLHHIETEDTVQAMLEWEQGALGTLHLSTAEAGSPERLEIVGTGGRLEMKAGKLCVEKLETDIREFIANNPEPFAAPKIAEVKVELESGAANHIEVYCNFHNAVLYNSPLMSDGIQGRMSLELSNALNYSAHTHREVELPLDRQQYANLLQKLQHPGE